jgi:CheY-like chemotaxis protein
MPGTTWRIVVADDHADTRDLYAEVLSLMHFTVATAANGQDALALCLADRPHAVVADLRMPKMNGYELLEAMRQHDETRDIPAIATSASPEEEQRALSSGFESFCAKPCDPQRLTLAVVAVLLRRAVADKSEVP